MNKVIEILRQLESSRFWGKLEVEMRDGEVTILRKSETLKVENTRMVNTRDDRQYKATR